MPEGRVEFMHRALQLARLGKGFVAPNPMVGCLIHHPHEGIIGEGWHRQFGDAHAEVNAIRSVSNQALLTESTLYVTLEPCSHFGKTPPCADLIIEKGIPHVVVACQDPNPLVAGKGILKLKEAGIKVDLGLLEADAWVLNKHFMVNQLANRPFITLKWAQTEDGYIARTDGSSKWISSAESRMWVHKWRSEHQAILAGKGTLLTDNPQLTVRNWTGPNPIRLVADRHHSISKNLNVFDAEAETIVFPDLDTLTDFGKDGYPHSLFVEGGRTTIQYFIDRNLWDIALVFIGPMAWGKGLPAPVLPPHIASTETRLGPDRLLRFNAPFSPGFRVPRRETDL